MEPSGPTRMNVKKHIFQDGHGCERYCGLRERKIKVSTEKVCMGAASSKALKQKD